MKRAISGLLFVGILTACIFTDPLCFFALFLIINIIGILEFAHMAQRMNIRINRPVCVLCGCLLFTAGFLHNYISYRNGYLIAFQISSFSLFCWYGSMILSLTCLALNSENTNYFPAYLQKNPGKELSAGG